MKKVVLGIDTGSVNLGWAVVEDFQLKDYGFHEGRSTKEGINDQTIDRMRMLLPVMQEIVRKHEVTHICIERVPVLQMAQRDKVVGTANLFRVMAMYQGLYYSEVAAITVKKQITGNAKAEKSLVRDRVVDRFKMDVSGKKIKPDVFDAVGVAAVAYAFPDNKWWEPLEVSHV